MGSNATFFEMQPCSYDTEAIKSIRDVCQL